MPTTRDLIATSARDGARSSDEGGETPRPSGLAPGKLKVLFLAANPRSDLRIDEEIRGIQQRVWSSGAVEIIPALAARREDLIDLLNRHKPHIVHFSGHGSRLGQIYFVGADGSPKS